MVIPAPESAPNILAAMPGAAQHPYADNRHFGDIFVNHHAKHAEISSDFVENCAGLLRIALRHGKNTISLIFLSVLRMLCTIMSTSILASASAEEKHFKCDPGLVRHAHNRRFGNIQIMSHATYNKIFFFYVYPSLIIVPASLVNVERT